MDTIYDTLAKLNKVANAPEIVKEDSNALMKKGLEDLMKKTKFNKDADYKPFGKGDKDYEDGLSKDAKKDKMFDDMAAADASKMNKQKNYTPFSDKQSPDGLPEKKKDNKMFEKESDVERDDRAEKAGREVKRDAKYDRYHHAGRDGKDVTKDIEYDEKHDKDGMHEASKTMVKGPDGKMVPDYAVDGKGKKDMKEDEIAEISNKTIDSYMDKVGQEDGHEQDMETASSKREKGIDLATAKQLGNAKVKATENSGTLKDAARQGVMARLAELAGLPAQEIEEALGTPQDIANKIMSENPINEASVGDAIKHAYDSVYEFVGKYDDAALEYLDDNAPTFGKMFEKYEDLDVMISNCDDATCRIMADELYDVADQLESGVLESVEEGNEFSGERDKAIKAGKNDFTVDGKTYPVKGDKNESIDEDEEKLDEDGNKKQMQDVEEGMSKEEFEKEYPGQGSTYDKIKKELEEKMDEGAHDKEEKVEETTGSGAIADGAGAGKPLYKNASVYESNEIVKRAMQLNEDMSVTVSAGTDAEPNININASGEDAAKMAELCKLAGIGMMGMGSQPQSPYGEVEIQVAEDQEFANGADDQNTMDTEYMTQDIAGGLNGPKKMAYPKVAGADNPMAVLGESELNEVGEERLMKLYQEYKAK